MSHTELQVSELGNEPIEDGVEVAWWTQYPTSTNASTTTTIPVNHSVGADYISLRSQTMDPRAVTTYDAGYDDNEEATTPSSGHSTPYDLEYVRSDLLENHLNTRPAEATARAHVDVAEFQPLQIIFVDGSESLRQFPENLLRLVESACKKGRTRTPECVKRRWSASDSLFRTATGKSAKFVDRDTHEELLCARYWYGPDHQIVVVKRKDGKHLFGGDSAIVIFSPQRENVDIDGETVKMNVWNIWNPEHARLQADTVLRCISNRPVNELKAASASSNVRPLQQRPDLESPLRRANPDRGKRAREFEDGTEPPVRRARPSHTGSSMYLRENPRPVRSQSFEYTTSDDDFARELESGRVRNPATGNFIAKRKPDGSYFELQCPQCDKSDARNVKGLFVHIDKAHHLPIGSTDDAITRYGTLLTSSTLWRILQNAKSVSATQTDAADQPSSRQQHATTSKNLSNLAPVGDGPWFVFKKSAEDQKPRTRRVKECDSARKLFAHAFVAEVADEDTLVLLAGLNEDTEPLRLFRDDTEDFENLMDTINNENDESMQITISTQDLSS